MYIYTPRLCGPSSCTAIKRDTITLYGQAGQHYESSCGVAVFEAGSHTTYFDVNIVDDDSWEPIRSFVVGLLSIERGQAVIGQLHSTTCVCADDDLYPSKVARTEYQPRDPAEIAIPSCINSDKYLTSEETPDSVLITGFVRERWKQLWPHSFWGAIWSVYRAWYHVGMSLIMVIFIDHVYLSPEADAQQAVELQPSDSDKAARLLRAAFLCITLLLVSYSLSSPWLSDSFLLP